MRTQRLLFLAGVCALISTRALAQIAAFPGAEGFGALATGGRGGEVYHVTNLDDSGPGSFRDSVGKSHRTVVFDVGGYIELKSMVTVAGDIDIAGQTAPGDGIGILNYEVSFSDASNVIVRYMRFRQGVNNKRQDKKYTISIAGKDVIFDHCSIQWGRWDCIGMTGASNVTIQNCIIGEGVDPQRFGCICQSDNVTFSHNLWTNNQSRSPKAKGKIQYINNVVYNWGVCGLAGGHSEAPHYLDAINNYFIKSSTSNTRFTGEFTSTDNVYQTGNIIDADIDGKLGGNIAKAEDFKDEKGAPTLMDKPNFNPTVPVKTNSAREALEIVLKSAGCSLRRDAVDTRLIEEVKSFGTLGKRIKDPAESGGAGILRGGITPKDTDQDGIPDTWEIAHHLDPSNSADGRMIGKDGYSNLEKYLHSISQ